MSDNSKDDDRKMPPPAMPDNISFTMPGEEGDEPTRRIGGTPMFNPSFSPTTFAPSLAPMTSPVTHSVLDPGMTSTVVSKGQTHAVNRREKFRWCLPDAPPLPEFHPLDRMSVFVPHSAASDVSARISDVIRDRSIEATFDDSKGKASCVTTDGVDFRVRLYRGRNQYSHGIIVEVQRRFGTSINFFSDAKAILDASEGKTPQAPPKTDALPQAEEDDFKPNVSSSLSMVSKMLSHPGYDAQHLAMQTLSSLTDPSKMGIATSRSIAKELMSPGNEVGSRVAAILLEPKQDKDDSFGLRAMAMTILANSLKVLPHGLPDGLRQDLLPFLRQKLMNADTNPRMAHIAAKCVEHLIENEHGMDGFFEALESAAQVGNAKHLGLMRQAELCLQKIGSR